MMIVMVVFTVYAMSEYSMMIQAPLVSIHTSSAYNDSAIGLSSTRTIQSTSVSSSTVCAAAASCVIPQITSSTGPGAAGSSTASPTTGSPLAPAFVFSTSSSTGPGTGDCPPSSRGELVLTIWNSQNNKPMPNLKIQARDLLLTCLDTGATLDQSEARTNASGMASICCKTGSYNVTVVYENASFSASAKVNSGEITCISLSVPSGKVSVSYLSTMLGHCSHQA
jgi:hypothetical protein